MYTRQPARWQSLVMFCVHIWRPARWWKIHMYDFLYSETAMVSSWASRLDEIHIIVSLATQCDSKVEQRGILIAMASNLTGSTSHFWASTAPKSRRWTITMRRLMTSCNTWGARNPESSQGTFLKPLICFWDLSLGWVSHHQDSNQK